MLTTAHRRRRGRISRFALLTLGIVAAVSLTLTQMLRSAGGIPIPNLPNFDGLCYSQHPDFPDLTDVKWCADGQVCVTGAGYVTLPNGVRQPWALSECREVRPGDFPVFA